MNLNDLLLDLSNRDEIIITDNHRALSGKTFVQNIKNLSVALDELGIKNKRTCLLRMTNSIDSVLLLFAAIVNQAVVLIANPHDPIAKVCDTLEEFSVFALLTDRATSVTVEKNIQDNIVLQRCAIKHNEFFASLFPVNNFPITEFDYRMHDADIAIFSSGSTGEPKAILHNIKNLLQNAHLHIESIRLSEQDNIGITLPLFYSYGLVANLFSGLIARSKIFLNFQIGSIDASWIKQNNISVLSITPFIAKRLSRNFPSLKKITIGGDILYSNEARKLLNNYPNCAIYSTYGLTEAGPRVSTFKIESAFLNRSFIVPLGNALNKVTISLENDAMRGELWVNTPTHMLGYFSGREYGFTPQENTLIKTGDLYEKKYGELYFIGREKKIIFQGGEKLFPLVVENAIHNIAGVSDVVVSSSQDKEKGEIAKAYIVANNDLTLQEIRKKLKQRLARSLIPDQLEFVDYIPRSMTGKTQA
jgi:long-chain acyl-CoA synthetase